MKNEIHIKLFPNNNNIPVKIPRKVWRTVQVTGVITVFVLLYMLYFYPDKGLFILWKIAVPLLPLVFVIVPGFWRNSCPLAFISQIPRNLKFTKGLNLPVFIVKYGFLIAFSVLIILVTSRKIIFNSSGEATALLILAVTVLAFIGGYFFKGKSGFCSSICPVLPVERLYGQSPLVFLPNMHCRQCIGCTVNCYDYNPSAAYLADQYSENKFHSSVRRIFASFFPGYVLSYFIVSGPPENYVITMIARMLIISVCSSVIFYLLNLIIKPSNNKLPSLFGITAFTIYYWFSIPILTGSLTRLTEIQISNNLIYVLRFIIIGLSLYWIYRTYRTEKIFISELINSGIPLKTLFGFKVDVSLNIQGKQRI